MISGQANEYNMYQFPQYAEDLGLVLGFIPVMMMPVFAIVKLIKFFKGYVRL